MTLATQAELATRLARQRHPFNAEVEDAAAGVDAALEPIGSADARPELANAPGTAQHQLTNGGDWSYCVYLGRPGAGVFESTVGWALNGCNGWQNRLEAALATLADALADAGDNQAAEVAGAVINAAQNAAAERDELPPTQGDWWAELPGPVKALGIAAGIWVALDFAEKVKRAT
jgi:hypothetical protein